MAARCQHAKSEDSGELSAGKSGEWRGAQWLWGYWDVAGPVDKDSLPVAAMPSGPSDGTLARDSVGDRSDLQVETACQHR